MMVTKNTIARALLLGSTIQTAMGHTWLETIRRISSNGLFVGEPGYPRGYHPRNETGFNDDRMMQRILQVDDSTQLCKDSQQPGDYNDQYPRLTAAPGDHVALQYLENGHTTTPQVPVGRPYKGGIVSVYATTESIKNVAFNDVHGAWNADGTGGDKRGRLIASRFFDDGICFENRGDNSIPIYAERKAETKVDTLLCQTDIQIPKDFKTGETMNLYWVWEWPLNVNMDNQSNETYTTCAEIKLGGAAGNASVSTKAKSGGKVEFDASHPYPDRAIPEQMSNQFQAFGFGTGTNPPASATAFPTTSATAFPTTSSKAKTPGIKTVTVTADATTVTDYKTVTVGAGNGGNGGNNNGQQTSASSPSSFSAPATATATASASASASATTASTLRTSVRSSSSAPTSLVPVTSIEKFLKARATGQARRLA